MTIFQRMWTGKKVLLCESCSSVVLDQHGQLCYDYVCIIYLKLLVLLKSSGQYASSCIADITKSLHLPCSRDLFKLFAPQLLYTWLETQSATTIPYLVFNFKDLEQLLQDVEQEVAGQLGDAS